MRRLHAMSIVLVFAAVAVVWAQTRINLSRQAVGLTSDTIDGAAKRGAGTRVQMAGADAPAVDDCAKFDANGNLVSAGAACGSGGGSYSGGLGIDAAQLAGGTIAVDPRGNGVKVQMAAGSAPTVNDCAKFDATGNVVTAGAPCGTGGGSFSADNGIDAALLATNVIAVDTATVPTFFTSAASLDFEAVDADCEELTLALPGAAAGDSVAPGWPVDLDAGVYGTMFVSAPGVVTVRLCRGSGSTNMTNKTFRATIVRPF